MKARKAALAAFAILAAALPAQARTVDLDCVFSRQPKEADLLLNVSINEAANTLSVLVPRSGSTALLKATITQTTITAITPDSYSGQLVNINRVTGEIQRQLLMGPLGASQWESGQCKKSITTKRAF